jgi:hypothetical protein
VADSLRQCLVDNKNLAKNAKIPDEFALALALAETFCERETMIK